MPDGPDPASLVSTGDHDELLREVDRRCEARDWDGLVRLAGMCRRAVDRGLQLWAVADHVDYRLALEAPGRWAGPVVTEGAGRFTPGPLPEVAASTHAWEELAGHLPEGPGAVLVAHERVVRGENLTGAELRGPEVLDIPRALQRWEPAYPLATYEAHRGDFPAPPPVRMSGATAAAGGTPHADDHALGALRDLVSVWTTGSNGRVDAVAVHGDVENAIGALGPTTVRTAGIGLADAMAVMGWAAASGGTHGRRPGAATGRFGAWWALAALTGHLDDWPVDGDTLAASAGRLRWYAWDAGAPATGWSLHLAVEDPQRGIAWAVSATDA
ncbi:MAG: hypothetical protein R3A49_06160 [Acidimicrobiia bacterium]